MSTEVRIERIGGGIWDVWTAGEYAGFVDTNQSADGFIGVMRGTVVCSSDTVDEAAKQVADAFINRAVHSEPPTTTDEALLHAMAIGPAWIFLTKMSNQCRVVSLEPEALDIVGITDRDANQHKRIGSFGVELWRCRFSRGARWSYGTSAPEAINRAVAEVFKATKEESGND